MKGHVHCTEQPMGCKTRWNYDIHVWWSQHMKRHLQYIARGNRTHPPTSPNTAPATESDIPKYERKRLKRHLQCARRLLNTWLNSSLTQLLDWTTTWLNCYLRDYYLAGRLLSCYVTELLLDWTNTWLNCYLTEPLLDWTVTWETTTWLGGYFPELLGDGTITWLN